MFGPIQVMQEIISTRAVTMYAVTMSLCRPRNLLAACGAVKPAYFDSLEETMRLVS